MKILKNKKRTQNEIIEKAENFLRKTNCQKVSIDISNLNLIDACKVALICSTKFFTKYPNKKISWSVKDEETKRNISNLMLRNMELKIKGQKMEERVSA